MRFLYLLSFALISACGSVPKAVDGGEPVAMRYTHDGFSVDESAAKAHQVFERKLNHAVQLISKTKPAGTPITLVYVPDTVNLVDTPTSFTRDMGGPEAPTARIAAAQQYRGSSLRVIDPEHFSASMQIDCQNADNGARVFQIQTYVSNYDPAVRRTNRGLAPYAQYDDMGLDYSRQSGTSTDVFTIDTELTDCFGNVLRALSPVVEVTAVNRDQSIFFFSEFFGISRNRSSYVSTNLNGAKRRAVELVVAEMGLYIAGVPDSQIQALVSSAEPR
ncbi:MAG: hypothetical protein AAF950_14835 [Pseudomonadota bacterium]